MLLIFQYSIFFISLALTTHHFLILSIKHLFVIVRFIWNVYLRIDNNKRAFLCYYQFTWYYYNDSQTIGVTIIWFLFFNLLNHLITSWFDDVINFLIQWNLCRIPSFWMSHNLINIKSSILVQLWNLTFRHYIAHNYPINFENELNRHM